MPKFSVDIPVEKIMSDYNCSLETGLTEQQLSENLERYGKNVLPQSKKASAWVILLNQFASTVVIILFIAAIISFIYHHYLDAGVIIGIVIINAIVGFFQEYQAEKSIEALKQLVIPQTKVRRDGKIQTVSSQDIVAGDVVICGEGDSVPADARIISANNLSVSESSLTGESMPVSKQIGVLDKDTPMAEQKNMLWMGTQIVTGECEAVVIATGVNTVLGGIAKDISGVEEEDDHFKTKINELGKQMGIIAIISTALIFIIGYFVRHFAFEDIFIFSVAALVSALPEGLPVILTVILALSAKRLAAKNAVVRRLSATGTLAVIDTIVTDKTGTLTQNIMTVTDIRFPYQPDIEVKNSDQPLSFIQDGIHPTPKHFPLQKLLDIAGTCHNVIREYDAGGKETLSGDPTEIALVRMADKAIKSPSYYQRKIHQVQDLPFNQQNRWRASLAEYQDNHDCELFVIGSPENVVSQCSKILLPDHQAHDITDEHKGMIFSQVDGMTQNGVRVLALTFKELGDKQEVEQDDIKNLTFVGLVGIIDPPHPETKNSVAIAHKASINVIMATGDHPATARSIAIQLGIISESHKDDEGVVLTEADIQNMSDDELSEQLKQVKVFARMLPASKLRLASLLQKDGRVVAMTGDGVNDAPALKQADIGISMGKNGTDVAKEASDIVLTDDNFTTIVSAIAEGRTQLRNIRRTSIFYVSTNMAESLTLMVFLFVGLPIPLLPKQILWLNLVTGAVTDFALAVEPIHGNVLSAKPSKSADSILSKPYLPLLVLITISIVTLATIFFMMYESQGLVKARTILFLVLSLTQIYNMFNLRSLRDSVFKLGLFSSRGINIAFIISILLMLSVVYIPGFSYIFEFASVSIFDLLWCALASLSIILIVEVYKKLKYNS